MKSLYRYIAVMIYLIAILACIVIVIKPGASIFYFKQTINNLDLVPDAGFSYRYDLNISPGLFRAQRLLLFEDGRLLSHTISKDVVGIGKGSYTLSDSSNKPAYIYFASTDNSDPISNGRNYRLLIPLSFISRPLGIFYLIMLGAGLGWFLFFAFAKAERRQILTGSPRGILMVLDQFFDHILDYIAPDTEPAGHLLKARTAFWKKLFSVIVISAYFYVFMEWLFFITKPSFMSILKFLEKVDILMISSLAFSILWIVVWGIYCVLDLIAISLHRSRITRYLGAMIPAIILSCLALLLIDNFTYTILKFGISTSSGVWRGVYGILFLALSIFIYLKLLDYFGLRGNTNPQKQSSNRLFYVCLGILSISAILTLTRGDFTRSSPANLSADPQRAIPHPNIILLGSDGVNAKNLSVYGYERDTTPYLKELGRNSLVAENAYSNSANSPGSVISIFTGKLPTTTRVGFSPDILTGVNAFQHLPGILKNEGYKAVEFGVPAYIDAYGFNLQNGFDMVNNRSQYAGKLGEIVRDLGFDNPAYFLNSLTERISDRIQHIFYLRIFENPFDLVTKPSESINDIEKIDRMLELFDVSDEPLFIHVHLLGTHGPKFFPSVQVFSEGETQDQIWNMDFYDDAILSFDRVVRKVVEQLKANGQWENTVLIIYSDHAMEWRVNDRIPLIFHFPGDENSGTITQNAQNMDIAPTLLDYLGLPQPEWMAGSSLLNSELDDQRLIFGAKTIRATKTNSSGRGFLDPESVKPPFYQFAYFTAQDCQRWYELNLQIAEWRSGDIPDHTAPCSEDSLLSFDTIKQEVYQRLELDGFDISSLVK